jgi:hypothetical protein
MLKRKEVIHKIVFRDLQLSKEREKKIARNIIRPNI